MEKYWRTVVQQDGSDVILYTATTEEGIKRDLEAGESHSLILAMRKFHRRTIIDSDANHIDLAYGSLFHHRDIHYYKQSDYSVIEVVGIPDGLRRFAIGGHSKNGFLELAVCVYEDRRSEG